jgi:hypothetical protein
MDYDQHHYWQQRLQSLLTSAIKGKFTKSILFEKYIGCSVIEFYKHIEAQFTEDMTWNNRGRGKEHWEFDHIIECYKFDLSKEEDRQICFNYRNLRPMWSSQNRTRSKISKVSKQEELI